MRVIKFRFWRKEYKDWEYDLLKSRTFYQNPFVRTDLIPCQFTGLLDKNGKEIYEGDIVVLTCRENIGTFNVPDDIIANNGFTGREEIYQGEVVYKDYGFAINDKESDIIYLQWGEDDDFIEVIGNVYENPELLKETL